MQILKIKAKVQQEFMSSFVFFEYLCIAGKPLQSITIKIKHMITTGKKILNTIIIMLMVCCGTVAAADFTDEINSQAKDFGDGQHVIYELNVGMFTSQGTFKAAEAKLEDLHTLGIDIVWLMPIYPRGGGINSPYAATDFKKIKTSYGTLADLKSFVAAAHNLGMQVWLDWVPNHTATNAAWVSSHPEYYVQGSNGKPVNPDGYGDVYQLNYNNANLQTAMNDCLKYWIDQADVDGYRCDYISSSRIPLTYWKAAIPEIKKYAQAKGKKTCWFLGEGDISDVTRLKTAGFDYDYAWSFQTTLWKNVGTALSATTLKSKATSFVNTSKSLGTGRMLYLTSHDINYNDGGQTLTSMYGDNRYALQTLVFTLYGMPMIYNGVEVGGNKKLDYFNDATKVSWGNPDMKMQNTIRTLCALKHAVPAFRDAIDANEAGSVEFISVTNTNGTASGNVLAYKRKLGSSEAIVVMNLSNNELSVNLPGITAGDYELCLDSKTIASGVQKTAVTLSSTPTVTLEKKGYQVYVLGEVSTGISSINAEPARRITDNAIYNLAGQRVSDSYRGIVIQNGKKFMKR